MSTELSQIARSPLAFCIETSNLQSGIIFKNRSAINNSSFFHKFLIFHPPQVRERDELLKILMDTVHPCEIVPYLFTKLNTTSSAFLASCCGPAIELLCTKYNLIIPIPNKPELKLEFKIIVQFTHTNNVGVQHISSAISKEIQSKLFKGIKRNCLNLESFHLVKDLPHYCPLFQPKIFHQVISIAKNNVPHSFELILKNNCLRNIEALELLWGYTVPTLDLRNNELKSIADLKPIQELKELKSLWLSGNPLCDQYDEETYVKRIRELCPKLEKLDGMLLGAEGFPAFRRNYLINYEAYDLVHQFVERYFTVYDFNNRQHLEGLYHKDAMFSLTVTFIPGQRSSVNSALTKYMVHNRNLIALADYAKSRETLFHGVAAIMKLLVNLPATEHDPFSFSVDLLHYTEEKCAVIMVCGVFREAPDSLLDEEKILGFSRNFTLECINGEWCIINEMMHLYNALTSQQIRSFKNAKEVRTNVLPLPSNANEREKLIEAVKSITTLNLEWSRKCLEENNYDLKKCLIMFVDLYKVDKIPPEAFVETAKPKTNIIVEKNVSSKDTPPLVGSNAFASVAPPSKSPLSEIREILKVPAATTSQNDQAQVSQKPPVNNTGPSISNTVSSPKSGETVSTIVKPTPQEPFNNTKRKRHRGRGRRSQPGNFPNKIPPALQETKKHLSKLFNSIQLPI